MTHTYHGEFELSTDKARLDLDRVEAFLRASYWASERPREVIESSIAGSLCLGAYRKSDGLQVGFCRLVTDYATFGWLCDVFVDAAVRGQKLGVAMVEALVTLPEVVACTWCWRHETPTASTNASASRRCPAPRTG